MARRPRTRRRWPWITLGGIVLIAVLGCGLVVFGGAQLLLTPHHNTSTPAGDVVAVADGEITLTKMAATERVGTYGLVWNTDAGTGTATIGPTVRTTGSTVIRPISNISGELSAGTAVQLNPNIYDGDPQTSLGIPFTNVAVDGELGPMPAWQVDGDGSTWVLFVHGIDGMRESGLRPLPTLVDAGLPTLLITYRNDADAPQSPTGLISLGQTEWRDLESAADYALSQGATRFVLYGDSMGGSIVTRFMHESPHASKVLGMVLDAPVLDWAGVLQGQADRFHLGFLGGALQSAVSWRGDIDLGVLDELDQTGPFDTLPILLFQGLADPLVPPAESAAFAASLPNALYVPVADAGHIQSWNVDPAAYEKHLGDFIGQFSSRQAD
ncbi:prolyl oligopeptidase family serine peptidase [Leifsonia sp. Root4]|uniref:alpha/beta hydrolase family protein n=1 Tax=Leifsonia sp. Root4 TaxID=1736525 RepID=UPI0009E79DFE|nr:prolyl oligopeptidase family serine peptidase [Leifsonia sp. Root4]